MNARLQANLIRLSLTKGAPRVLTNDERARIFRSVRPSPKHNEHAWSFTETFPRPSPACLPPPKQQAADASDPSYFTEHSYADLAGGF